MYMKYTCCTVKWNTHDIPLVWNQALRYRVGFIPFAFPHAFYIQSFLSYLSNEQRSFSSKGEGKKTPDRRREKTWHHHKPNQIDSMSHVRKCIASCRQPLDLIVNVIAKLSHLQHELNFSFLQCLSRVGTKSQRHKISELNIGCQCRASLWRSTWDSNRSALLSFMNQLTQWITWSETKRMNVWCNRCWPTLFALVPIEYLSMIIHRSKTCHIELLMYK